MSQAAVEYSPASGIESLSDDNEAVGPLEDFHERPPKQGKSNNRLPLIGMIIMFCIVIGLCFSIYSMKIDVHVHNEMPAAPDSSGVEKIMRKLMVEIQKQTTISKEEEEEEKEDEPVAPVAEPVSPPPPSSYRDGSDYDPQFRALAASSLTNFQSLINEYGPICRSNINNVMNRGDQIGLDVPDTLREWSISDKTWGAAVLPFCASTKDLLDSMRDGRRRPVNNPDGNLESVDPFKEITYFEPSHCQYHFYNSDQSCSIYSHFSNVLMIGDSLTRHMEQALFQIFTGDFKSGSIPRLTTNLPIYSQCVCDGIFSENRVCRDYSMTMQKMAHSHAYGICTKYPVFRITAFPESYDLCDDDDRPRVLFVNVATHHGVNIQQVINEVLNKVVENVKSARTQCPQKRVLVAWGSFGKQAPILDRIHPNQNPNQAIDFNTGIEKFFSEQLPDTAIFDYMKLTAYGGTSDGLHYLNEVNLLKAQYFTNYLALEEHLLADHQEN